MSLLELLPLRPGRHDSPADGRCAMEMVAFLAGEEHTDAPRTACPVLAAVVRAMNDLCPPDLRDRLLRPLVPRLVHSAAGDEVGRARALALVDATVRVVLPSVLRAWGRHKEATALYSLPSILCAADAAPARSEVVTRFPGLRAARWLLLRAGSADRPTAWVAGCVHVAKGLGHRVGWRELARAVDAAVDLGRAGAQARVR